MECSIYLLDLERLNLLIMKIFPIPLLLLLFLTSCSQSAKITSLASPAFSNITKYDVDLIDEIVSKKIKPEKKYFVKLCGVSKFSELYSPSLNQAFETENINVLRISVKYLAAVNNKNCLGSHYFKDVFIDLEKEKIIKIRRKSKIEDWKLTF